MLLLVTCTTTLYLHKSLPYSHAVFNVMFQANNNNTIMLVRIRLNGLKIVKWL